MVKATYDRAQRRRLIYVGTVLFRASFRTGFHVSLFSYPPSPEGDGMGERSPCKASRIRSGGLRSWSLRPARG